MIYHDEDDDLRIRLECKTCCYAVTGFTPWAKVRLHEETNPGHVMDEVYGIG